MEEINLSPQVANLVHGLREIGYTLDTAIADLVDNSITADSSEVNIFFSEQKDRPIFGILDNGTGMIKEDLIEAMRPATKNPTHIRKPNDLGRYGLGLKTASFSQSKKLTVLSKVSRGETNIASWDLDKLIERDEWILDTLQESEIDFEIPLLEKFKGISSGTLVVWNNIDKVQNNEVSLNTRIIREHLSLVFNRFLSGSNGATKIQLLINERHVEGFDPLDKKNPKTIYQEKCLYKINNKNITVQPCILPSGLKTDKDTFERNATPLGYKEAQGFYLYRANRLISWGTWWRLHKRHDSLNLIRIEIDIDNNQDPEWSISVTKSGFSVKPPEGLKADLKGVVNSAVRTGKGVIAGRKRVTSKVHIPYWDLINDKDKDKYSFKINKKHPLYSELLQILDDEQKDIFKLFVDEIQKYLPVEEIYRKLIHEPKKVEQKLDIDNEEALKQLIEKLKSSGLSDEKIKELLDSEGFNQIMSENK